MEAARMYSSQRKYYFHLPSALCQGGGLAPRGFLPSTQIIFRQPIPENSRLFLTFFADSPKKKKSTNFILPPLRALFGHPVQFFIFYQKGLLTNPS